MSSIERRRKGDEMKFVNLTPHSISIIRSHTAAAETKKSIILPSGQVARCEIHKELCGYIENIPVYQTSYGEVQGLPSAQEGTVYIVSTIVAEACKEQRDDLLVPFDFLRDEAGNIIGCQAFSKVK